MTSARWPVNRLLWLFVGTVLMMASVLPLAAAGTSHTAWKVAEHFPANACVMVQGSADSEPLILNQELCEIPHSPCSTFKLPHALIALQTGVVAGPDEQFEWDGTQRRRSITNQDHTLATAIRHSVVWYFQETARRIGSSRMQDWLKRLDYGNADISGGIDNFWLASSLEITARQQLSMIQALRRQQLPFAQQHQATVRQMAHVTDTVNGSLFGKTGSCWPGRENESDYAWFVGWLETDSGAVDIVALHETPKALGSDLRSAAADLFSIPADKDVR